MEGGRKRRFNLLLLEHGEFLLESAAAIQVDSGSDGRLWICTKCVVFEPKDIGLPLEKLKFEDMETMPNQAGVVSGNSENTTENEAVVMEVAARSEMKKDGKSHPYLMERKLCKRAYMLQHRNLEKTLSLLQSIWKAQNAIQKESRATRAALEKDLLGPIYEKRQSQPFDKSRLVDFRESLLTPKEIRVSLVSQMTDIPGCIIVTDQRLYFQPANMNNIGEVVQSFPLKRLCGVYKRRFLLRQRALEVRFEEEFQSYRPSVDGNSANSTDREKILLLCFEGGTHIRDLVYDLLERSLLAFWDRDEKPANCSALDPLVFSSSGCTGERLRNLTLAWQRRDISNFEYLLDLNTLADRSTADLTQYPVFPWVIADYSSEFLDLNSPETFRDLSKPIGALNEERLEYFKERYKHMLSDPEPHSPPFLYGTHYTTPGYVLYYLVRKSPDLMLKLQNGQFDRPDRSFHSIASTWNSVLTNTADLKELIPEFYSSDGEFLMNVNQLDLGRRQDGTFVDDVILPPWCSGPRDFIEKCRNALESEHVSSHLHEWIDLIFGYKQRGEAAKAADNLFFYLTYEGAVDLDKVMDEDERKSFEAQIYEFGQTPKQLFVSPHPGRNDPVLECASPQNLFDSAPPIVVHEEEEEEKLLDTMGKAANVLGETVPSEGKASTNESSSRPKTPPSPPPNRQLSLSPSRGHSVVEPDLKKKKQSSGSSGKQRHSLTDGHAISSILTTGSSWWTGGKSDSIAVYSCTSEIMAHRGPVSAICCGKNDEPGVVRSVSLDGTLSQVSLLDRTIQRRVAVGKLALSCCAQARDGSLLVGSWDNCLYTCCPEFGRATQKMVAHDDAVSCVSTCNSGRTVVTGSWESSLKVWSAPLQHGRTLALVHTLFDHGSEITAIEVDTAGRLVISASSCGDVFVHDLRSGLLVQSYEVCRDRNTHAVAVFWIQNETCVVICSEDGIVDVVELVASSSVKPIFSVNSSLQSPSLVTAACMTPDRLCVVLGTSCGRVSLCNVDILRNLSSRQSARVIWKQPVGARLDSEVSERKKKIWRSPGATKGTLLNVLPGQAISSVACICVDDVNLILAGCCKGVIQVLEPTDPKN